ncbi:MAG: DoxX family membrane protein [Bacteroidetes bacterium]|nr:DoxX family membrane protein [Bacteroidota bacterium]
MHTIFYHHEVAAALLARIFLGLLFFFQGIDAVFNIQIRGVLRTIEEPMSKIGVPKFLIITGTWFACYIELIGGFLLIIGFAKYYVMYLLGLDLIIASIALSIMKAMWDMQFIFPRFAILIFLLVIPSDWDVVSVDYVWSIIKFFRSLTH